MQTVLNQKPSCLLKVARLFYFNPISRGAPIIKLLKRWINDRQVDGDTWTVNHITGNNQSKLSHRLKGGGEK